MVCRVRRGHHVSAVVLCLSLFAACESEQAAELGVAEGSLSAAAGSNAACVRVDTIDSLPDRIDEDCDGRIDEDADAKRSDCPRGVHVIEGTRGNDVLHGTSGRDCILGYGGNDTLYGESGDDVIFGGPGDDRIFTGKGRDLVHAGPGADNVDGSSSSGSTIYGESGADVLTGGPGDDSLFGGADNDVLNGGGGSDKLNGGDCHDLLVGADGCDTGAGGKDFDACDTEHSTDCERIGANRVLCTVDANCSSTERCAINSHFCVPRSAAVCGANACTATRSVDDTCDGIDDDCDGPIDDDYVAQTTHCGAGACGATGLTMCVAGVVKDSCRQGAPLPGNDATCDAVDDDCDGHVDEGFAPAATHCGVGVCASSGATSCVGGAVLDSCHQGTPTAANDASCNGLDDDCDGVVDDDYVAETTQCGTGACSAIGMTMCVAGAVADSCRQGSPLPGNDATCDAVDDDCDGSVDEAFASITTNCGVGVCASSGATSCVGGAVLDSCHPSTPADVNDASCNGLDDDCDGASDEEFVAVATQCGLGVCASMGTTACNAGVPSDSCQPGAPTAQIDDSCNGLDDDCNGAVDEAYTARATSCGFGACLRHGDTSCVSGHEVDSCHVDCEGQCNDGAEDDGDGLVDCADSDCANAIGCIAGGFGSPCKTNADCTRVGGQGLCVVSYPGGYCTHFCSLGCPTGTICLNNQACVVDCGPGEHCGRTGFECSPVAGSPPVPWCHPTCAISCPAGKTCNPATVTCQ